MVTLDERLFCIAHKWSLLLRGLAESANMVHTAHWRRHGDVWSAQSDSRDLYKSGEFLEGVTLCGLTVSSIRCDPSPKSS